VAGVRLAAGNYTVAPAPAVAFHIYVLCSPNRTAAFTIDLGNSTLLLTVRQTPILRLLPNPHPTAAHPPAPLPSGTQGLAPAAPERLSRPSAFCCRAVPPCMSSLFQRRAALQQCQRICCCVSRQRRRAGWSNAAARGDSSLAAKVR